MKLAILAGGLGTRLREETEFVPKPMVQIGDSPIIWHIMKSYSQFGIRDFVVCSGYKGQVIKDYFFSYRRRVSDFTLKLNGDENPIFHDPLEEADWQVTVANTGQLTMTGGRLYLARRYLTDDIFLCTYGDGLSDVNISQLIDFHKSHGRLATVTVVRPRSRFGQVEVSANGKVNRFREKPEMEALVNAGFFVFNRGIFDYLDQTSVLENETLFSLAAKGELFAFVHHGFWQAMDTFREFQLLNDLWNSGDAPWKTW